MDVSTPMALAEWIASLTLNPKLLGLTALVRQRRSRHRPRLDDQPRLGDQPGFDKWGMLEKV